MELEPIERVISGKGTIRIDSRYNSALSVFLYADLLRNSSNPSINNTWNPDKGFYAHITFCIGDYVLYTFDMNFKQQVWQILSNQEAQNLLSLICAYDGILDSFVQYATAQGIPYVKINLIKEHPYLKFVPDRIKFECFGECAIRLVLKGQKLEKCDDDDGTPTPTPEPPPPAPPEVPPTTPVTVSEPYDLPGGDPDTEPFPIDVPPVEPPVGEECVSYDVTYRYNRLETIFTATIPLWGEIGGISIDDDSTGTGSRVLIECRGISISGPCGEFRPVRVESEGNLNFYSDAEIISILPS